MGSHHLKEIKKSELWQHRPQGKPAAGVVGVKALED
jgi:hypothetical protein